MQCETFDRSKTNPEALFIDGCDCAIIKVDDKGKLVYDYHKLVEHFADHIEGRPDDPEEAYEQAIDWVAYNIERALPYYGDWGPSINYEEDE